MPQISNLEIIAIHPGGTKNIFQKVCHTRHYVHTVKWIIQTDVFRTLSNIQDGVFLTNFEKSFILDVWKSCKIATDTNVFKIVESTNSKKNRSKNKIP